MRSLLILAPLSALVACASSDARTVDEYDAIENRADAKMEFTDEGEPADTTDTAEPARPSDADVQCTAIANEDLLLSVEGGVLIIEADAGVDASSCTVRVPAWWMRSIVVQGNGEVEAEGTFRHLKSIDVRGNGSVHLNRVETDELTVEVSGNGDVQLDGLYTDSANFELGGNGNTTVVGSAAYASLTLGGDGDFRGADFVVEEMDATISGSGEAELNVTVSATISVSGSGHVLVEGGGAVVSDITGSGSIDIL